MQDSASLFFQASTLMFVGMGFVFAFLGLLVLVIKYFISPLALKYPDSIDQKRDHRSKKLTEQNLSPAIVAAISAAVSCYRHHRRQGQSEGSEGQNLQGKNTFKIPHNKS